jgi:threonine aldolase
MIDLRSDTVTLPTPAMREAMYKAEVGDDVYGEDPTVNRLEAMAAERMGKQAALFVVSGTMGNLVATLTHCGRGDEIILGTQSHIFLFEAGGSASLGGVHHWALPNQPDGTLDLDQIRGAIRAENVHAPRTRVICLENTHNRCGGAVLPLEYCDAVGSLAQEHNLAVHLDGARVFNAAVALGLEVGELVRSVDSVSFCLSKGLSAPVGAMLCGEASFIAEARRWRKAVGGGMRQCGILAAAGIVALEQMVERLAEDHANAARLAEGIAQTPGLDLDLDTVQTDIVIFGVTSEQISAAGLVAALRERGVQMSAISATQIRAVTHYGIGAQDIKTTLQAIADVMEQAG